MRRKVVAGNWKMNFIPQDTIEFIKEVKPLVQNSNAEVILCAPFIDLKDLIEQTRGSNIKVGAQNMHWEENGAYTGEISPNMLKAIGVQYVIIGHSERRQYFGESDETVNQKVKSAFLHELIPIVCVGETLEQHEAGKTTEVITNQIKEALKGILPEQAKCVIIAYEPIWAIGTGKTASAQEANESIKQIRKEVERNFGLQVADEMIIQYGGSVKASNAKELFTTSDIDGALVGGASLKVEEFSKIVNYDK